MEMVTASARRPDASVALADFQFPLPAELIAQVPAAERDQARLLVLDRASGGCTHTHVRSLPEFIRPGDVLIVNDTQVIPARLFGRTPSGGAVEVLLVRDCGDGQWVCLGRPARRLRPGACVTFADGVRATVEWSNGDGRYAIRFADPGSLLAWLELHGEIPLPPYIRRPDGPLPLDRTRYQTIFAANPGAIAAPTAGLHFTPALVAALRAREIDIAALTLHVGPGTFRALRCADIREHVMEAEWCTISPQTVEAIERAKARGARVVAVGTTTARALESGAIAAGRVPAGARWADCFITPGWEFRVVDALFTNFHLPGSTLLLLVSAFASRETILAAYAEAIARGYRFYSYGDAMLIQ